MVISFAEIIVFIGVLIGISFALRPFQKWMEIKILKTIKKPSQNHITLLPSHFKDHQKKE